jgi:tetratricopeptide (TPR) repeat protein
MLGSALFQDPGTAPQPIGAAAEPTASSWLWDLARSPGFLETVVALVVFAALVLAWWRLSRLSERIKSRALLRDWFLGVEQALHGDSEGAEARLLRVLQADPENHYARLLLGNVHLQRGHPEKAHAEHLLLRDSFAIRGGENGMQLAKALLAAGQPAEAAAAAAEVAKDRPQDAEAQELWFRCLMQQGDFQAAVEVGERLVLRASASRHGTRVSNDAARQRIASLRNDVAHACCQAGAQQLWRGDRARAQALLRKAELLAYVAEAAARKEEEFTVAVGSQRAAMEVLVGKLRAQFEAIHACAAPVHWPCAAHVGHVACESVPEQATVAGRGAAVAAMKTGAAVGGAAAAEQQLRAQFDSIHAREELVHSPCDAQAAHEACKKRTNESPID